MLEQPFRTEAVNAAWYLENRVLIRKLKLKPLMSFGIEEDLT